MVKYFFKFFNGLESDNILSYVKNNFSTYKIFLNQRVAGKYQRSLHVMHKLN